MNGPGNGDDGCAVADGGRGGDGAVSRGDAVNLMAAVDLVEGHGAEDRREDHSGGMDVDEVFVPLYSAARGLVGDFGSADGVVGGRCVHGDGGAAEGDVEIALGAAAVVAALGRGARGGDACGGDGNDGDEAEALVDLQHVRAPV